MLQAHWFAGNSQFAAQGRFFLLQSSNAATLGVSGAVEVFADGVGQGTFYQGDSIELEKPAQRWEVRPASPGLVGSVVIGSGNVRSARVSGSVSVVDNSAQKTAAGLQFFGGPSRTAAAGFFVFAGLRAQSRAVVLRSVRARPSGACSLFLYSVTGTPAPGGGALVSFAAKNRQLGAADSTAAVDHGAFTAFPPPAGELPGAVAIEAPSVSAGEWHEIRPQTPFLIPAGRALCIVANVAALQLVSQWDFEEVA